MLVKSWAATAATRSRCRAEYAPCRDISSRPSATSGPRTSSTRAARSAIEIFDAVSLGFAKAARTAASPPLGVGWATTVGGCVPAKAADFSRSVRASMARSASAAICASAVISIGWSVITGSPLWDNELGGLERRHGQEAKCVVQDAGETRGLLEVGLGQVRELLGLLDGADEDVLLAAEGERGGAYGVAQVDIVLVEQDAQDVAGGLQLGDGGQERRVDLCHQGLHVDHAGADGEGVVRLFQPVVPVEDAGEAQH